MVAFHLRVIFTATRRPVAHGSVIEGVLSRRFVRRNTMPYFKRRLLNSATERKRDGPRQPGLESHIHRIQTLRSEFTRLTTRQERHSWNSGRDDAAQALDGRVCFLVHGLLLRTGQARQHHIGFEDQAFQEHALRGKLPEHGLQHLFRSVPTSLQGVRAIHENFRLDDWDQPYLLAQRCVTSKRLRVGLNAATTGDVIADSKDGAPFGKARAHGEVFR